MMTKKATWMASCAALLLALVAASQALAQSEKQVKAEGHASVSAVRPGDKFRLAVALEIGEGYHINANVPTLDYLIPTAVKFEPPPGITIKEIKYPKSKTITLGWAPDKPLAVYEGKIFIVADAEADASLKVGNAPIRALVTVQACNDKLCLNPGEIDLKIPLQIIAAGQSVQQVNADLFAKADAAGYADASAGLVQFQGSGAPKDDIATQIASQGIIVALLGVFVAGLLLNATPCVYPIIPITIGFFVNQGSSQGKPNLRRAFLMATMYVLGMAITYSILGVVAAMTKGLFGAALQNPFVLIGLAALMVALALSMFGVYEFKLPESLNEFANRSAQATSGMVGALVMGLTMGIVAAPCIGPFVLGLLVHVGAKGDPVYGFFMFFVLALGLGTPYLFLGTFSGAIKTLPRSGEWMVTVRKVFGLVLIGMALYFLMPLMGDYVNYVFVAFFAISALYLIFYEASRVKLTSFAWVLRAIGVGAAAAAIFFAIPKKVEAGIPWQPYSEQALAEAQRAGKGVIIDVYADWCIPCKELDQLTFTDAQVREEAARFVTLKLDLTKNDPQSEAGRAKERFEIRGVPTIIFLDPAGREIEALRLEGFEKADAFLARMKQVESAPASGDLAMVKTSGADSAPVSDAAPGAETAGAAEPLPDVSLKLLEGGSLDPKSLRGKVALIDFWATWCVPCISEIPMFNQLTKEYKDKGFEMIAVSLDEEGAAKVKPFLKEYPMNYTQVIGDASVAASFKVDDSALPVAFLVDKQGRIRYKHVGVTKKEVFESQIKQLLSEP
ncbi:MAG TPA: cytochrome c biogenesis protein CcdA [Blastocatellia bacterium]|nr:cytochrome c biogenesis protein CcdA [Blastocatellia bacterium]